MAGILKCDQVQSDSNLAFAIAGSNVAFMNATSLQMVGNNISLAGTNVISSGKLITAAQPVGSILQVVQTQTGGTVSATNVGTATFFFQTSFVPLFTSSRFLVMANIGGVDNGGSGRMAVNILQNTTSGGTTGSQAFQLQSAQDSTGTNGISGLSGSFIYSGGTFTAGTTYYVKAIAYKNDTSTTWAVGQYGNDSNITVMEIAA